MNIKTPTLCLLFLLLPACAVFALPNTEEGKTIFMTRCTGCHKIDKDLTGPALVNVHNRHSMDWIIKFVHASQTVIKSGDTSATALFAKFNSTIMPDHPDLSDDNIRSIVNYIKEESAKVSVAPALPFDRPVPLQPNYSPVGMKDIGFVSSYLVLVAALVTALLFAVQVKELQRKQR